MYIDTCTHAYIFIHTYQKQDKIIAIIYILLVINRKPSEYSVKDI